MFSQYLNVNFPELVTQLLTKVQQNGDIVLCSMLLMKILRIRLFSKQDICFAVQVPHDPESSTIIFYPNFRRVVNVVFSLLGRLPGV
jgi:hypothetical protein